MKTLYVLFFDPYSIENIGVKKKIDNQLFSMRKLGLDVDIAYLQNSSFILEKAGQTKEIFSIRKGFSNYRRGITQVLKKIVNQKTYKQFYFRFPGSVDWYFFNILKYITKRKNLVILELPTYPYEEERKLFLKSEKEKKKYISYILRRQVYFTERIFLPRLKKYVKNIVTFMSHDKIWGIDTIVIENGVNTDEYPPVKFFDANTKISETTLVLTGVANISIWHGFDRIIEGIKKYNLTERNSQQYDIIFNIVGNGAELNRLKKIVDMHELNDYVHFLGPLYDDDLKKVYETTNLAIGSTGMHRINLSEGSTLKAKEYCSLGIPFIIGYKEKGIPEGFNYYLKVPADESPIDMQKIIDFYNSLPNREQMSNKMHEFAILNFSWDVQMKKVFFGGEIK